jgi:hypothetical protein
MPEYGDKANNASPGLLDALDLSVPLRGVYQAALKSGDLSARELSEAMPGEPQAELKVYLNLLCRLGYLEKYVEGGSARFCVKGRMRGRSKLPDGIWSKLGAAGGENGGGHG